jgi:DNA-binding phage protein
MGKTIDFKPRERADLVSEVAPKLDAARARLADLEAQLNAAALADALGEMGAAGRLAQLDTAVETARREVAQLEGAHRLAVQRDGLAQVAVDAKVSQAQLAAMQRHGDARFEAMVEVCAALELAAKAYTKFFDETERMALAVPLGMIPRGIQWNVLDLMVDGSAVPAAIDAIVAGEMYRHGDLGRADRMLPGARAPAEILRMRPTAIEPASEAVRRMNEYLIGAIKERLKSIEQAAAAQFSKSA